MSKIYKSLTELIGKTPLLELTNYEKKHELKAGVIAKTRILQSRRERQGQDRQVDDRRR